MSENKFGAILTILVPQIIDEIIQNENISDFNAIDNFYRSMVYSVLEDEKTKLWHLSPKAIYELYKQEKETGTIDFPEEA